MTGALKPTAADASTVVGYRRYLAAVANVCAAASGHPDPIEVIAAVRLLQVDVPRTLARLEVAS